MQIAKFSVLMTGNKLSCKATAEDRLSPCAIFLQINAVGIVQITVEDKPIIVALHCEK